MVQVGPDYSVQKPEAWVDPVVNQWSVRVDPDCLLIGAVVCECIEAIVCECILIVLAVNW